MGIPEREMACDERTRYDLIFVFLSSERQRSGECLLAGNQPRHVAPRRFNDIEAGPWQGAWKLALKTLQK